MVGVGFVVAGAVIMRTLGRVSNPVYTRFTSVLAAAHRDFTPATKAAMAEYDFTFSSWPVEFNVAAETGCVLNSLSSSVFSTGFCINFMQGHE